MDLDLYIDVIFLVNFVMDLLLLILLKRVLKKAVSWRRLGLGAVLGGFCGCLEIFFLRAPGLAWPLFSLAGICAMVLGAFGWQGGRELVKETGIFFVLAIMAGGAMELLLGYTRAGYYGLKVLLGAGSYVMPLLTWVFLAGGVFFLVQGLWQFGDEVRKERRNLFRLILADGAVAAEVTGYLDTGNCLEIPGSGEMVHIVTERVFKLFEDSRGERAVISYHTIGNPRGVMEGLRIERMEILGGEKKIRIEGPWIARAPFGLSKRGDYEVLLHGDILYEMKCSHSKGV